MSRHCHAVRRGLPEVRTTSERAMDRFRNRNRWRNNRNGTLLRFEEGHADLCLRSLYRTPWGCRYRRLARLWARLHSDPHARLDEFCGPVS